LPILQTPRTRVRTRRFPWTTVGAARLLAGPEQSSASRAYAVLSPRIDNRRRQRRQQPRSVRNYWDGRCWFSGQPPATRRERAVTRTASCGCLLPAPPCRRRRTGLGAVFEGACGKSRPGDCAGNHAPTSAHPCINTLAPGRHRHSKDESIVVPLPERSALNARGLLRTSRFARTME